ncbi:MAG: asparagine synthase (glutamine-hydrolyzing) [Cyanobacteria bacterium DS2.3.42]|nr:asparagine synthase (glutamine-hydrolyzing) [Cyanobacteria bacterium DS2.3.42]
MCGIAGLYSTKRKSDEFPAAVIDMLSRIKHRGPDESGYFFDDNAVIGSVRLSIIDLHTGSQPMCDQSGRYWIAYNGEVYNYLDLKEQLKARGHSFATESDTEVVLLSYVEWGVDAFKRFNGGFAVAIYDTLKKELVVARDRYGKRPLYYHTNGDGTVFASEMKAFAGVSDVSFAWDKEQLSSTFAHWVPIEHQTGFKSIKQLPTASCMIINAEGVRVEQYDFLNLNIEEFEGTEKDAAEITREKLRESVRLRLQSDVEVGVYLSGGLDSSITSLLAKQLNSQEVRSFSVAFADESFDESQYQSDTSKFIGTNHTSLRVTHEDIARDFPHAVYHAEVPLFRTALVPLYTLSKMVREHGIKVVLTGEGSDETFLGYDIFKETNLLDRWIKGADESERDRLVAGLYPYLKHYNKDNFRAIAGNYARYAQPGEAKYFGHSIRFGNSRMALRFLKDCPDPDNFLSGFVSEHAAEYEPLSAIAKSQWLEFKTLLGGYLLSSQGDRMALANGVENRCPFLDPNLVTWAFGLPVDFRLKNGTGEKNILKLAFKNELPESVLSRPKQPFVAPDAVVFLSKSSPDYVESVLSVDELRKIDFLDHDFCQKFISKLRNSEPGKIAPRANQAFLLLLSMALLDRYYVRRQHASIAQFHELENITVAVDGRQASKAVPHN